MIRGRVISRGSRRHAGPLAERPARITADRGRYSRAPACRSGRRGRRRDGRRGPSPAPPPRPAPVGRSQRRGARPRHHGHRPDAARYGRRVDSRGCRPPRGPSTSRTTGGAYSCPPRGRLPEAARGAWPGARPEAGGWPGTELGPEPRRFGTGPRGLACHRSPRCSKSLAAGVGGAEQGERPARLGTPGRRSLVQRGLTQTGSGRSRPMPRCSPDLVRRPPTPSMNGARRLRASARGGRARRRRRG